MIKFAQQTDDPQLEKEAIENLRWGCCFLLYGCQEESIEEVTKKLKTILKIDN